MSPISADNSGVALAIVGGGGSGTLMALALAQRGGLPRGRILVINSVHRRCRGIAYDALDDNLLLNAPAGNMSALAGQADHFVRYCQTIDPAINAGSFVPRRLYGDYLESAFALHCRFPQFDWLDDEVLQLVPGGMGSGFRLTTRVGRTLDAHQVVLATGHQPSRVPEVLQDLKGAPNLLVDPWDWAALDRLPAGSPILVLGTGHTAVDVLFRLTSAGQRQVLMLSRHGWLPEGHRKTPRPPRCSGPPDYLGKGALTSLQCVKALREEILMRSRGGEDWRDVFNELRPYLSMVWAQLNEVERARFLRHGLTIWDVHRHRLAPLASHRLQQLVNSSLVDIRAGRLVRARRRGMGFEVTVQPRGAGVASNKSFHVGAIVNCTGPSYEIGSTTQGVLASLVRQGRVCPDTLNLGLVVNERYQLIDRAGSPIPHLHYLGPLLKARYWETIAIPELREHASHLADMLLPS